MPLCFHVAKHSFRQGAQSGSFLTPLSPEEVRTQQAQQDDNCGQSSATSNLSSIPPDQAVAAIEQEQTLLQQTVSERVQSILTPDQGKTLQGALSQFNIVPQGR
jgi:hypothetical protein